MVCCSVCFVCVYVGVCLVECALLHGMVLFSVLFVCMLVCVWLNAHCCLVCFFSSVCFIGVCWCVFG